MQTLTTVHLAHRNSLRDKENLSDNCATLFILPDPAYGPEPSVAGIMGDFLQKPAESPHYAKLLEEENDWRASGILHDFNNQLAIILSHCSLALTKLPNDSTARSNLERAIRATKRAADLSNQLQIDRTAQAEEFVSINWNDLVRETVDALEPRLTANASLERNFASDLPPLAVIPSLLQRAMLNILTNAIEAICNSNGRIEVVTEQVIVSDVPWQGYQPQMRQGAYAMLQISDNGHGMDQATLNQIFDPYFSTRVAGMGMGLTLSLHIIQLHRGIVQVRSKPHEGTTFRILLPIIDQWEHGVGDEFNPG